MNWIKGTWFKSRSCFIPLSLIGKHLSGNFKFHNNIDINNDLLSKFSSFYQDIFIDKMDNATIMQNQLSHLWSCLSSFGLTQTLRLTVSLCIFLFSDRNLNLIGQLVNDNGNIKP